MTTCTCNFGAYSVLLDDMPDDLNPHGPTCPLAPARCDICGEPESGEMAEMYEVYNGSDDKGPTYHCPECGTANGLCGHVITYYCHAQCGLSRGYEVA